MPVSTTPNPDLALWIAGLGFLSSLLVVAVNSIVTIKSKNKDVQLKKDEQSYGFRMEYLKRKLDAGEREITSIFLTIGTIITLQQHYSSYIQEESEALPDELKDYKSKIYDEISEKNRQYILEINHGFNAYFKPSSNTKAINELIIQADAYNDKIVNSANIIKQLVSDSDSESVLEKRKDILMKAKNETNNTKALMAMHIKLSQELVNNLTELIHLIREEMLSISA